VVTGETDGGIGPVADVNEGWKDNEEVDLLAKVTES
jgi:hypothetical protein